MNQLCMWIKLISIWKASHPSVHTALFKHNSSTFQGQFFISQGLKITFTLKMRQQTLMKAWWWWQYVFHAFHCRTIKYDKYVVLDWFKQFRVMYYLEIQGPSKDFCHNFQDKQSNSRAFQDCTSPDTRTRIETEAKDNLKNHLLCFELNQWAHKNSVGYTFPGSTIFRQENNWSYSLVNQPHKKCFLPLPPEGYQISPHPTPVIHIL